MKFKIIGSIILIVIVIAAYALKLSMQENTETPSNEPSSGFVP